MNKIEKYANFGSKPEKLAPNLKINNYQNGKKAQIRKKL